ncbi:MAG: VWA domain-containing protein [Planctomycetes bacterium]|nr:VWA domain-containing protein [Planctomycetota bacterium]
MVGARWAAVIVALAAGAAPRAAGFASVTREEAPPAPVVRPAAGGVDQGGGTPRPLPRIEPEAPDRALTLRANRVRVVIREQVAVVHVEHVLQSNVDRILQARYLLPLGARAHVTGYAIWEQGVRLEGELMDVARAEDLYRRVTEQEVAARPDASGVTHEAREVRVARDPGLMRQMSPDVFDTHVYPILPWALKQVEVTYGELVAARDGRCAWSFPFHLAAAFGEPVGEVVFDVTIEDAAGVQDVACPWPGARVEQEGGRARVRFEAGLVAGDVGPFELTWRQGLAPLQAAALAHRSGDGPGHVLVRVAAPPATAPDGAPLDVVLAVDASGSQRGPKASQQARVLAAVVDALRDDDRVARLAFDARPTAVDPAPAAVGDRRDALRTWPAGLTGKGRTLLAPALARAGALLGEPSPGRRRLIVLATDGVTEEEPDDVLAAARAVGARLLVIGSGHDDDPELLARLAEVTGGALWLPGLGERDLLWTVVPPDLLGRPYGEALVAGDEVAPGAALLDRFRDAAVTGVVLDDPSGTLVDVFAPAVVPAGGSIVFVARYAAPGERQVTFRARVDGQPVDAALTLSLPAVQEAHAFVAGLWARERARELLRRHPWGPRDPNRAEVVALSLEHRFLTPYTAFLSLPDAERRRMLLGARPPDRDPWRFESAATPEAETWALIALAVAAALLLERRRRAVPARAAA